MSYYKRKRYSSRYSRIRANQQAIDHVAAYCALERRLGSIIGDVRQEFFSLPPSKLAVLLAEYEKKHGYKAAEYARETMPKWRSGKTKMSGQTAERLLNLVPKYLAYERRFCMVQKLCEHHAPKIYRTVTISPDKVNDGLTEVERILSDLLNELPTIKWLPEHVVETVKWLNDDDVTVTRGMLAEIDRKRADIAAVTAKCCLRDVRHIINQQGGTLKQFSHTVDLPNGILTISLKQPSSTCFIATAAFGSKDDPTVAKLRVFRDKVLKQSVLGRLFIHFYYRHSPRWADLISKHPKARAFVRVLLRQFTKFY